MKFVVEHYPNVNNEVIATQFIQHIDSEILTDVKAFLDERTIVHPLSSNFQIDSRSDDEDYDFPSDGQETQNNVYFYKTLKNGKKPLSQYSAALLQLTDEVNVEEQQQLENISRYTPKIPVYLRRENNKEDNTAPKLVEDVAPSVPLKSNNQIKEEDKKQDITAKLGVDDERSETDIDQDTTAKSAGDSDPFAHSDSEESEDLCLRSPRETTPDNSLENVTLDQAPSSYLDESIRQCFFEWLSRYVLNPLTTPKRWTDLIQQCSP